MNEHLEADLNAALPGAIGFQQPVSGNAVMTSLLEQELAPLNAQIEKVRQKRAALEEQLGAATAEFEKYSAARQRFDALQVVCDALDNLSELKAGELFWKGIPGGEDAAVHLERIRGRVTRFEEKTHGIVEKQADLQAQIDRQNDELAYLFEEVQAAYEREERRREEFVIEREISPVPYRAMVMPWTKEAESERRFRRAILLALLLCLFFGSIIPMISVPVPDYSVAVVEIPERLAKLVKQEPPKPVPPPKPAPQETPEEPQKLKDEAKPKTEPKQPEPDKAPSEKAPAPEPARVADSGGGEAAAARKKAERVGVLAFKKAFADLMDETPVAKLGAEARLSKDSPVVAGQAVAQRSLVAMQAQGGSSGGIAYASISRNIGYGNGSGSGGSGIGRGGGGDGLGFSRVESSIAGATESGRPLSDGPGPGRTDEEIQIVFDRYKAALYRIYNRELRKDPTLRGKVLLRISIETDGAVSLCEVESTDLESPELVAMIVERIKRFNFGPKEGVPTMTILYPIDFLPAA
jgi:outer membrane murein-binding lipoprotein Lpp